MGRAVRSDGLPCLRRLPGMARHAGAERTELDGAIASEPMAFRLGEAGAQSAIPKARQPLTLGPVQVLLHQ